jgi:hypothetical protein
VAACRRSIAGPAAICSARVRGAARARRAAFSDASPMPHAPASCQVWVIVMSLGYILFVTVLHIVGKVCGGGTLEGLWQGAPR